MQRISLFQPILLSIIVFFSIIPQRLFSQIETPSPSKLARDVLIGGPAAEQALRTALFHAGISIREKDNQITPSQKPAQGIVINHWEIDALLNMTGKGMRIPFLECMGWLTKASRTLDSSLNGNINLGMTILQDLKT